MAYVQPVFQGSTDPLKQAGLYTYIYFLCQNLLHQFNLLMLLCL